jgi:hypothetical protein
MDDQRELEAGDPLHPRLAPPRPGPKHAVRAATPIMTDRERTGIDQREPRTPPFVRGQRSAQEE